MVFLLPLFWLPFSFEAFEFNKQYLLFFLVSAALFTWLAKMVFIDKEVRFRKTPLDLFVLVFLLVVILSAVFSVDRISSIFGFYGRFSDSLISLLSLGIFYFLITNNVGIRGTTRSNTQNSAETHLSAESLVKAFSWSVFFVVLFSYFSIFGLWEKMNATLGGIFPQLMLQNMFNPASGSMEGLTIFLAAAIVLFTGLFLSQKAEGKNLKFQNIFYLLLILASLGILEIIDFRLSWIVLLAGLLIYLLSALITRLFKENVTRLLLPIFLIIIAVVLFFFNVVDTAVLQEYVLGQRVSWQTGFGAATENIKSIFLGSGPGTYFYDFAKFKPLAFNQDPLWYVGFDRPGSHFAEILGTMGFLGLLSYLALIVIFLIISWFLLKTKISKFQLPLLIAFFTLAVGQIFYYQNTTLAFSFWLMLGLGVSCWQGTIKEKIISFRSVPEMSLVFSTFLIILGAVILVFYYFGVNYYLADVNYRQGISLLGSERTEKLQRAVRLNPRMPQYRLALSRSFLTDLAQELQDLIASQDVERMENLIRRSIGEAEKTVALQSNSAINWINKGIIYRELNAFASSTEFLKKAAALEPANPIIYTEIGNLYLVLEKEQEAKKYFQMALDKKPYYAVAIIQLALILEKEEVLDEAIIKLEELIVKDPWNVEAHYQLGRLYYNAGRIEEAIGLFEAVAFWVPQHSNSLYSLGVAYTTKGQIQEAILVFEEVLRLNPGNQDVIQKLQELKGQARPEERLEQQPGEEELEEKEKEEEEEEEEEE